MNANLCQSSGLCDRSAIFVTSPETLVQTEIVSDSVLPREADRLLSEVWKPFPDAHVDVIETDTIAGIREYRQHNQFFVTKTWFVIF